MILPPSPVEVAAALARMHERGTIRDVKAKGTEEDEAELRAWQREAKAKSRAKQRRAA